MKTPMSEMPSASGVTTWLVVTASTVVSSVKTSGGRTSRAETPDHANTSAGHPLQTQKYTDRPTEASVECHSGYAAL